MSAGELNVSGAQRWLRFADEDLRAAQLLLRSEPPRIACFHSQQAAEKAIKALLVLLNTPFPRTHDLERLQLLLPDDLQAKAAADLPELTDWVIDGRYPADRPEASHAEAVRALALARDVVTKAREDFLQLSRRPPMPEITATLVNQLRAKTGQAMMECKKMLTEAEGDIEKAIDMFRKKGVKASLTERAASEGRIAGAASPDGKSAALVEINCNTDFTAKSEPVQKLAQQAAQMLLNNPSANVASDPQIAAAITDAAQRTGENVRIGKTATMSNPAGKVGLYIYVATGKVGVLMSFTGNPSDDLIKQIGGHIAFSRPLGLSRAEVPAEMVAKEKEIAVEQAKATGKPQQIAEKIAEGKLNAFFAERVLLDQEFFNAQVFKGSVQNYLKQSGVTLEKYVRVEVGQA